MFRVDTVKQKGEGRPWPEAAGWAVQVRSYYFLWNRSLEAGTGQGAKGEVSVKYGVLEFTIGSSMVRQYR